VPAGALILTASVDVQGNRVEVKVKGYGRGEESSMRARILQKPGKPVRVFVGDTELEGVKAVEFRTSPGGIEAMVILRNPQLEVTSDDVQVTTERPPPAKKLEQKHPDATGSVGATQQQAGKPAA
jgi:hypothetical protein